MIRSHSVANPPKRSGGKYIFDACGISGFINIDGTRVNGKMVNRMIQTMVDRENGLGGGFAAYGLFPKNRDDYCIQLLLDNDMAKSSVEEYLKENVEIVKDELCPIVPVKGIRPPLPLIWRFFVRPPEEIAIHEQDDYMVQVVMHINTQISGAFCMSSGKDMAVFKGNGWSRDVAEFYKIEDYDAFLWLAHSRFPTNTPGWWGGAHPFNILDWSVIHNGEITSYGTNKRYLEAWGYQCTMLTDTEVVAYLFDLLIRRHQLPIQLATMALAPPYYDDISQFPSNLQEISKTVRMTYRSALLNGPFSILVASNRPAPTLIGLTDRKKLRPLIGAISEDEKTVYMASEECAIQALNRPIKTAWAPQAGRPMVAQLGVGVISTGNKDVQEIESISMPLVVKTRK